MPAAALPDTCARLLVIANDRRLADAVADGPVYYETVVIPDARSGITALQEAGYDIILADLDSLGDVEGAVTRLARLGGAALLLVVAETESVSAAVEALQAGAHECLSYPLSADTLTARIATIEERYQRRSGPLSLRKPSPARAARFIAQAPLMQVVREQLTRIAQSSAPVFLTGEGGTGKHLAAETLHSLGPNADKPFVAINCAMTPPPLDGSSPHAGLMQLAGQDAAEALITAGGGTLYLNEISALRPAAQARLLSFVDPDLAVSVTGSGPKLGLRIVCSTRQSAAALVREHGLRQDLFYRLNVLPIHLPPLRQRPEDVLPLALSFLRRVARGEGKGFGDFTAGAMAYLEAHEWPGNVRQLENLIQRTVSLFDGRVVTPQMLAAADVEGLSGRGSAAMISAEAEPDIQPMWRQEQRIIEEAIARFNGNVARAAAALEISPSTIYRKKQAWDERSGDIAGAA